MDGAKAATGKNQFDAYKFLALFHVAQQFDFLLGSRRKIRVPAFGAGDDVPAAIPKQDGLTQTGAGCQQCLRGLRRGSPSVESGDFGRVRGECQTVSLSPPDRSAGRRAGFQAALPAPSASTTHGRFVAFTRWSMTGPATPKPAASIASRTGTRGFVREYRTGISRSLRRTRESRGFRIAGRQFCGGICRRIQTAPSCTWCRRCPRRESRASPRPRCAWSPRASPEGPVSAGGAGASRAAAALSTRKNFFPLSRG